MYYKNSEVVQSHVADYRKKSKMTQQELADAISVTRQTIIAIEKGNYIPSVLLALKLSKTLHHPVEELFAL